MVMDEEAIALIGRLIAVATEIRSPEAVVRAHLGPDRTIRVPGGWIKPSVADAARDAIAAAEVGLATATKRCAAVACIKGDSNVEG